jgi:hypothetical protein
MKILSIAAAVALSAISLSALARAGVADSVYAYETVPNGTQSIVIAHAIEGSFCSQAAVAVAASHSITGMGGSPTGGGGASITGMGGGGRIAGKASGHSVTGMGDSPTDSGGGASIPGRRGVPRAVVAEPQLPAGVPRVVVAEPQSPAWGFGKLSAPSGLGPTASRRPFSVFRDSYICHKNISCDVQSSYVG